MISRNSNITKEMPQKHLLCYLKMHDHPDLSVAEIDFLLRVAG